jgi:hypothetical protein
MAHHSTPHSRDVPRARWIALAACALCIGAAAVLVLRGSRPDPAPVLAPAPAFPSVSEPARAARPAPTPTPTLQTEATPALEPARPEPPGPDLRLGTDGVLAVPLVVPIYASTIPEVRIPAGARGVRLLIDMPLPSNIDGLSVFVRGPEGPMRARFARADGRPGLAVELDAALQAGVHEVLVTYEDETTAAQHRLRVVPASAAPGSPSSP